MKFSRIIQEHKAKMKQDNLLDNEKPTALQRIRESYQENSMLWKFIKFLRKRKHKNDPK